MGTPLQSPAAPSTRTRPSAAMTAAAVPATRVPSWILRTAAPWELTPRLLTSRTPASATIRRSAAITPRPPGPTFSSSAARKGEPCTVGMELRPRSPAARSTTIRPRAAKATSAAARSSSSAQASAAQSIPASAALSSGPTLSPSWPLPCVHTGRSCGSACCRRTLSLRFSLRAYAWAVAAAIVCVSRVHRTQPFAGPPRPTASGPLLRRLDGRLARHGVVERNTFRSLPLARCVEPIGRTE
jgi:hypothetical protein